MPFRFSRLQLPEVIVIEPRVFSDERGFFMETYKYSEFAANGIVERFVQSNHSHSPRRTLRGLHYQKAPKAQGKLVQAAVGEIFDVVVDIRQGSPRYGEWLTINLSSENNKMLYVPPGFAHGACIISTEAILLYSVTAEYAPEYEAGIAWNDPRLSIRWPFEQPVLSARDQALPYLSNADNNFVYEELHK
jgi:dTDP-4-dehydrorhamnose 3,5-epimerase